MIKLRRARALSLLAATALLASACGQSRDGGEPLASDTTSVESSTGESTAEGEAPTIEDLIGEGGGVSITERDAGVVAATITFADGTMAEVSGEEFDSIVAEVAGSERFINNIYQGNFGPGDERYMLGQVIMARVFEYTLASEGVTLPDGLAAEQRAFLESDLSQAMVTEPDPAAASAEVMVEISTYVDMLTGLIASQEAFSTFLAGEEASSEVTLECARHILVGTEAEATDLISQIGAGADFSELAIEFSTDPGSGQNGGDLGCAEAAQYVEPFALAMQAGAIDEIVGPVASEFGYHIITVYERRQETVPVDTSAAMNEAVTTTVGSATIVVDPVLGVWDSSSLSVIGG